jgi:diacylglycerol kinase (ATP)
MDNIDPLPLFWHVIINPVALRGGSLEFWKEISTLLVNQGLSFKEWHTTSKNDATNIAQNLIKDGAASIVVVGGDGTLNEVVNGIMQCGEQAKNVTLAVLPAGTGNDWSRTHRFPKKMNEIASMFLSGAVIGHDIGVVKPISNRELASRYFINIAGLGFDAAVIERVHRARKFKVAKGMVYVKHLILSLLNYQSVNCKLVFDHEEVNKPVFSIAAGICKYNGNGMMPVPMADPTDGLLDVVVIEKMKTWQLLTQIPALFKGTYIKHPKVSHYRVKAMSVFPESLFLAEVEGELIGEGSFCIEIAPQKINVLVPSL